MRPFALRTVTGVQLAENYTALTVMKSVPFAGAVYAKSIHMYVIHATHMYALITYINAAYAAGLSAMIIYTNVQSVMKIYAIHIL